MNLNKEIEAIVSKFDGSVSLYAIDEHNNEIKFNENDIVETASCIKVFILVEYYRQVMNGEKTREDLLVYDYNNDYVKNGSGIIQHLEDGLTLSSKNMAILMTIVSDNIATNKMIEYLGYQSINKTIKKLGFKNSKLIAKKLDFSIYHQIGETTAYEYTKIFKMLLKKEILTPDLCDEIIHILSKQTKNDLLTKKLPLKYLDQKGSDSAFIRYIATKSGGLGGGNTISCRNDGGIIATKLGNYIISIFINNFSDYYFYSDNPATLLGSEISKILFKNFEDNNGQFSF